MELKRTNVRVYNIPPPGQMVYEFICLGNEKVVEKKICIWAKNSDDATDYIDMIFNDCECQRLSDATPIVIANSPGIHTLNMILTGDPWIVSIGNRTNIKEWIH